MKSNDQFLTSICQQVDDGSVTSLLGGDITKGAKRPDGTAYPCLTVATAPAAVRENYGFQVFDGTITIYAASNTNGSADSASLSAIEAALITLLNVDGWVDPSITCKSQVYRGTYGPFWDAQDGQVHYQSLTFQSYIV